MASGGVGGLIHVKLVGGWSSRRVPVGGPRREELVTVVALVERAGDGGGNYPDETRM